MYEKEKNNVDAVKEKAAELEKRLKSEYLTQAEMDQTTGQLHKAWDDERNRLRDVLNEKLDSLTMEKLLQEQIQWIKEKEKRIQEAENEVAGGSMEALYKYQEGASITHDRVYELLEYL